MKFEDDISLKKGLIEAIRGYDGYQKTETRGKSDQRLREHMASQIERISKDFDRLSAKIQQQGNEEIARSLMRLITQLKVLINTLNRPSYNNSSFFNLVEVNSGVLSQLYEYESKIQHQVEILTDEVTELENIREISETDEFVRHFFDVVDNLNQIIMEREFLLAG